MKAESEVAGRTRGGIPVLLLAIVLLAGAAASIVVGARDDRAALAVAGAGLVVAALVLLVGLFMLQPNQTAVLTLFGDYRGTDRTPGLRFANPLLTKHKVSLRIRNFTTQTSKVNDANGNPLLIAAVVVWKVTDTARATFAVDDLVNYVHTQSESAVRNLARAYPYDAFDEPTTTTLIGDPDEVNTDLLRELQERAEAAGVEIIEARITDLSYAPEIAEAMLRRQQAAAIVAARAKIVEGAVAMVRQAVSQLEEADGGAESIRLDAERKAIFACNLMTVIASDQPTNPVVNVTASR